MAIQAFVLLMLTLQGPSCCAMVKHATGLEPIGDVAVLADPLPEDALRMWVLMTRDASGHLNRSEFSLIEVTFFAFDLGMLAS